MTDLIPLSENDQKDMNFAMRLSFSVGIFMLIIKVYAYFITGSAAILSDAAESVIHVFAVGFAAYSMWLSFKPADEDHPYGHDKITYFSAGFEGAMIIIAALFIVHESIIKIIYGFEITNLDDGMMYIILATLINLLLSLYLIRKGKKYKSIILEANGKHILTDCWTSICVIVALVLVKLTGIVYFDPCIALIAATNILFTGAKLLKRSVNGLMDQVDPELHKTIVETVQTETSQHGTHFHHLRHRVSGHKVFIEFHLLFPNDLKLDNAHLIACQIEANIKKSLKIKSEIFTHLEPFLGHEQIHQKYGLEI